MVGKDSNESVLNIGNGKSVLHAVQCLIMSNHLFFFGYWCYIIL